MLTVSFAPLSAAPVQKAASNSTRKQCPRKKATKKVSMEGYKLIFGFKVPFWVL